MIFLCCSMISLQDSHDVLICFYDLLMCLLNVFSCLKPDFPFVHWILPSQDFPKKYSMAMNLRHFGITLQTCICLQQFVFQLRLSFFPKLDCPKIHFKIGLWLST